MNASNLFASGAGISLGSAMVFLFFTLAQVASRYIEMGKRIRYWKIILNAFQRCQQIVCIIESSVSEHCRG
jgi:hypothetical protein